MVIREVKIQFKKTRKTTPHEIIQSSESAESVLRTFWIDLDIYESFYVLLLDRANQIIGIQKIGQGGISQVAVDLRLIFSAALGTLASSIIVAHNHPSGSLKPSQPDLEITKKLVAAGEFLSIRVVDHIILAPEVGYTSFADQGLINL